MLTSGELVDFPMRVDVDDAHRSLRCRPGRCAAHSPVALRRQPVKRSSFTSFTFLAAQSILPTFVGSTRTNFPFCTLTSTWHGEVFRPARSMVPNMPFA